MATLERNLTPDLSDLLGRMRSGDREAAALFMAHYGDRVRRRVSGKLSSGMRRLFDSQEIMSTVARRLDRCVSGGEMIAAGPEQLWELVFRIAQNSVIDKGRIYRRLQRTEGPDQAFAVQLRTKLQEAESEAGAGPDASELELDAVFRRLPEPLDREILAGWLRGLSFEAMSQELDMRVDTVRKRFLRIKRRLRSELAAEPTGGV